jgi:hypothetical protein
MMNFGLAVSGLMLSRALLASAGLAQEAATPPEPPRAIKPLLDCRGIADGTARLACFDREVAAFDTALNQREVVVADREEVTEARRSLFGLSMPTLKLFSGDGDKSEDMDAIEATIASANKGPDRLWRLTLDNGSRWAQTEGKSMVRDPKAGMPVRIRRAVGGSFLANVDGQTAIRVRRYN